jgi:hypothetical protein
VLLNKKAGACTGLFIVFADTWQKPGDPVSLVLCAAVASGMPIGQVLAVDKKWWIVDTFICASSRLIRMILPLFFAAADAQDAGRT